MKKIILCITVIVVTALSTYSQISRPEVVKKKIPPVNTGVIKPIPPPTPVYTLTSAKVSIRTGNDNKESGSNMIFFFREKDGIWGKGNDLFQTGYKNELKVNSAFEFTCDKVVATPAANYSLDNLQARGLYFAVYYSPGFFADAWKIESITVTLEFKDQFGNLHPSFGNRIVQYNIANGLLTNERWLLKATADGNTFIPSPVTVTNQF